MNGHEKKKLTYLNKREVVLICLNLLLLCIIIRYSFFDRVFSNDGLPTALFTIITAVICSILAAAVSPRSIGQSSQIEEEAISEIVERVGSRLQSITDNKGYAIPSITYYDTDDPNLGFDKKLNESLSVTKKYVYFSDRALYLPKRLSKMISSVDNRLTMTVILADIREPSIYEARAELYNRREIALHTKDESYQVRSVDQIIREEKIAVLQSLYALGQLKNRYRIEIYLHKEIPFLRFEMTDSLLILTFLTQLSTGKKYPASVFYENESLFRLNFEDYSKEVIKRSEHLEDKDCTLNELLKLASSAKLDGVSENDITNYYNSVVA